MSVDLHIDDRLIEKAIEAGRHKTAEEAVATALEEYIRSHEPPTLSTADAEARERMKILEWVGKVDYFDDYDHKELRRRKPGSRAEAARFHHDTAALVTKRPAFTTTRPLS